MKIAVIGQSAFGVDVYNLVRANGHQVVGVFTVPDKNDKEDLLAQAAAKDGVAVFKFAAWRRKGHAIPAVVEQYKSVGAELNIMPFCSQFIPMEVISFPKHQSIIYHPSILPRHRGASAINWTLIHGDETACLSVFWADDGLHTGPILLQRQCDVLADDTLNSLYKRFLYPEGVKAMAEAVEMIAAGTAPRIAQPSEGATYEPYITAKPELAELKWEQSAQMLHNFIRGNDKVPGAWATINGQKVTFYASTMYSGSEPPAGATKVDTGDGGPNMFVCDDGLLLAGNDSKWVKVGQLKLSDGRTIAASKFGRADEQSVELELTDEEKAIKQQLLAIWRRILNTEHVLASTDFFASGAGSMDVTRLVEEVKQSVKVELQPEDVYMASAFTDFVNAVVVHARGGGASANVQYDPVVLNVNDMTLSFPYECFIDGQFVPAMSGSTYDSINPTDERVICKVALGDKDDVDKAVHAAHEAFHNGEWGRMSSRDRGKLLYRLADLMEEHKEQLATIETIDSGAVYTLALKTHVGMSIDTWRYFAGWCDKIQGSTVPISHARPNRNLTLTRREPIGVCGLVTPWNYPLMMLSWKMAACLAAGNTVVHKPAQVSPLTALKFAELSALAGIPKGVINIVPGSGRIVGQAIADHALVRKLGFTGSTPIGMQIMKSCAVSNLKKCSLELGGKSPLIIFADADMDKAVRQSMGSVFFNKGENCIAAGRLFVAKSVHDEFIRRVVAETAKMAIGDPMDRGTAHGPQNHLAHLNKLIEYIDIGVKEGAKLVYGGKRVPRPGYFLEPTIFTHVQDGMYIAKEESFGPIMIVSSFDDDDVDSVLCRANATEFGLASGVFSRDVSKVLRVAERLDAGTVFVNCYNKTDVAAPFGGFKQSGFGKDLGEEALHEYLKTKTITIEY